jgi:hypothetical protein
VIRTDERSHLIAIIPDCVLNPRSVRYRALGVDLTGYYEALEAAGYGLMSLPSHLSDPVSAKPVVSLSVRDAVNYLGNGYEVIRVAVDGIEDGAAWRTIVEAEFARWKVALPPEFVIGSSEPLPQFLERALS